MTIEEAANKIALESRRLREMTYRDTREEARRMRWLLKPAADTLKLYKHQIEKVMEDQTFEVPREALDVVQLAITIGPIMEYMSKILGPLAPKTMGLSGILEDANFLLEQYNDIERRAEADAASNKRGLQDGSCEAGSDSNAAEDGTGS